MQCFQPAGVVFWCLAARSFPCRLAVDLLMWVVCGDGLELCALVFVLQEIISVLLGFVYELNQVECFVMT
jgi:hypothetical protein